MTVHVFFWFIVLSLSSYNRAAWTLTGSLYSVRLHRKRCDFALTSPLCPCLTVKLLKVVHITLVLIIDLLHHKMVQSTANTTTAKLSSLCKNKIHRIETLYYKESSSAFWWLRRQKSFDFYNSSSQLLSYLCLKLEA